MDLDKLDPEILEAVRQRLGAVNEFDDLKDHLIARMTPLEVFTSYLEWEGIQGYGTTIWNAVENIKQAAGETDSSAAGKEDAGK